MPPWVDVLDAFGLVVAVVLVYGISLVLRRRLLSRHGGTFELSHRMGEVDAGASGSWVLGLGRYTGDDLEWFRVFTLSPRPKRTWRRSQLAFDEVRDPAPSERDVLYPDHLVVSCGSPQGVVDLAMSRASLTGFQAWLESRTPGSDWSH